MTLVTIVAIGADIYNPMNKQQILNLLKNTSMDTHDRELLLQYLHYIQVEGIEPKSAKRSRKKKNTQVRKKF